MCQSSRYEAGSRAPVSVLEKQGRFLFDLRYIILGTRKPLPISVERLRILYRFAMLNATVLARP